ncbi:MAG TPA: M1 family aminopeptidase [Vicinamibacterales bacterium]|nr:M1 family aminopeptidase [Vicinamibacterales bacterium]
MRVSLIFLFVALSLPAFAGQVPSRVLDEEELSIQAFLQAVETTISTMDRARWTDLLSPTADKDQALEFFDAMIPQAITRVVVKERDRSALQGALPGEGYRLVVEVLIETGSRGRIATWRLDIRRPRGEDIGRQPWRVLTQERLASIEGLHRLALQPDKQYAAKNLVLKSVDFELRMPTGDVFVAETAEGVTAIVLLGDGTMVFQPGPKEEKGQLKLFSGTEALETPFTNAFVRVSPFEFEQRVTDSMLEPVTVDSRAFRRGVSVFDEGVPKSFNLDLSDLSREVWSLLPQPGDFVAEVKTRRFDDLTFARSSGEAEDVTMFQRRSKRNICVYASEHKLQSRGRFFDEDDNADYDILDYDIDASFYPDREWMEGRTRLNLRVKSHALGVLTLRFAESLNVSSVASDEFGRMLFLRVRNQNSLLVNLPTPVARDFPMTLTITYSGRMAKQNNLDESVALSADSFSVARSAKEEDQRASQPDDVPLVPAEPKWLFSNRNYWYPQNQVSDYATAHIRISVPLEYSVVASGILEAGSPTAAPAAPIDNSTRVIPRATYSFVALQPVRYLGIMVSRMIRVDAATVALDIAPTKIAPVDMRGAMTLQQQISRINASIAVPPVGARNTVRLAVEANRRQESRGRDAIGTAAEILRLYSSLTGDVPYDQLTVAMVEDDVPGGHAPGYFAMLNNPPPVQQVNWRNDPAAFQGFPEFFMAHELAHQWFGQAVGWKNYHEQWLSEGFAQYFAALYAKDKRGEGAFRDVLRQFRKWAIDDSDQGPVYLGYRLGHIKNESRVFRALVYNKGAAVLHMLRRLIGDEAFFSGLKQFYAYNRFAKAGTDDLRLAMQSASGRDLTRFFERWIYDNGIPRLRYSTAVEGNELVVRFEQSGDIYDVPVTMAVTYTDGKTSEFVVTVNDAANEARLALTGTVRSIDANPDGAAIAIIEKK